MAVIQFNRSIFLNIGCNYIFIFGKFGAPELGVTGAALGTLIARIFEFVFICMYLIFLIKNRIQDSRYFYEMPESYERICTDQHTSSDQ